MRVPFLAQTGPASGDEALEELSGLTPTDWLIAGGIVVAAVVIGLIIRAMIVRGLTDRSGPLVAGLVGRLSVALVVAFGVVYSLNFVGVSMGPLLGLLGLLGLAFALAAQEVLANFIAGVMLSVRRPFRVGDEIGTSEYQGTVEDVSLRSTTLRTFDGVQVIIPNSTVWDSPIVNNTSLGTRRTEFAVGVAYDTDLDEVQKIILDTVESIDGVRDSPQPDALVHEFADSSINFAVRFWHAPHIADEWRIRDEIARNLKRRLDDAGVEIPFPQVVVHSEPS